MTVSVFSRKLGNPRYAPLKPCGYPVHNFLRCSNGPLPKSHPPGSCPAARGGSGQPVTRDASTGRSYPPPFGFHRLTPIPIRKLYNLLLHFMFSPKLLPA